MHLICDHYAFKWSLHKSFLSILNAHTKLTQILSEKRAVFVFVTEQGAMKERCTYVYICTYLHVFHSHDYEQTGIHTDRLSHTCTHARTRTHMNTPAHTYMCTHTKMQASYTLHMYAILCQRRWQYMAFSIYWSWPLMSCHSFVWLSCWLRHTSYNVSYTAGATVVYHVFLCIVHHSVPQLSCVTQFDGEGVLAFAQQPHLDCSRYSSARHS